ncbi:hypothetical protein [Plantibacter sp. CFBP 13570]|uniref:hypothetical protein n=1 Tax=Plantibacter sp. CFBP 13570 TaxID=2775272 RepID=UPI001930D1F2|nr:hypothetical protein [Plantibacter sp. CFBP 13570]MBD8535697.1 hypothetical protein [Plantibacter sp. CFBP 13570]
MNDTAALAASYQLYLAQGLLVLFVIAAAVASLVKLARGRYRRPITRWVVGSLQSMLVAAAYGLLLVQLPKLAYALATQSGSYLEQVYRESGILFGAIAIAIVTLSLMPLIMGRVRAARTPPIPKPLP